VQWRGNFAVKNHRRIYMKRSESASLKQWMILTTKHYTKPQPKAH